jgi:NAD-dependent DNA ligase
MTQDDFLGVDGFKERLATKIRTGIETKLKDATLAELMHASNLFGRGFGLKRLQAILDAEPTIVQANTSNDLVTKLQTIPGMAAKTSTQFGKMLPTFVAWMEKAGLETKLNTTQNTTPANKIQTNSNPLFGKKYVITGFRDKALVKKLTGLGAIGSTSVSKNTDFVIVKSHDGDTGKAKEARALGLKLVTQTELMK